MRHARLRQQQQQQQQQMRKLLHWQHFPFKFLCSFETHAIRSAAQRKLYSLENECLLSTLLFEWNIYAKYK